MQSVKQGTILEFNSDALSFRNKIINGNFDIWQRSTSQTSSGYGSADRWVFYIGSGGSPATTISKIDVTTGGGILDLHSCSSYLSFNQTAQSTAYRPYMAQKIEDVRLLMGKTITLSFYAWTASGTQDIRCDIGNSYGTGGSGVEGSSSTVIIDSIIKRYALTVTLPSGVGKTLGTDHHTYLYFNPPMNSTYQIYFAGIQLEEGVVVSDFEQRPIGIELQLCQRYYSWSGNKGISGNYGVMIARDANYAFGNIRFPITLRKNDPTVTLYGSGGSDGTIHVSTVGDKTATPAEIRSEGFSQITAIQTWATGNFIMFGWTADAEL